LTRYLGVDLAWGEGSTTSAAKETGLVCLTASGEIIAAAWARGIDAVAEWLSENAQQGDVIAIDAPLVVNNESGMRECEREVAQRYGRWKVAANATNRTRPWQGGVTLRKRLEAKGFVYTSGSPASVEQVTFFECYPYTTLVGAPEFGYDVERPRYKRFNNALMDVAAKRSLRASECDELIRRTALLSTATPALALESHPNTEMLVSQRSPLSDVPYKHREDLLDAALCAWTAALWHQYGDDRCQVLGKGDVADDDGRVAAIIAPAKPEQRAGARQSKSTTRQALTYSELLAEATKVLIRNGTRDLDGSTFALAKTKHLAALDALEINALSESGAED